MVGLVGITQSQLEKILNKGDAETIRFCQMFSLIPKKKKCPTCKQGMAVAYKRGNGKLVTLRCGMAACRYETTVRARTIFEGSKLSIQMILRLISLICAW